MDFAFMFIPSEAVYYDLLINKVGTLQTNARDLIEYAFRDKRVIIVSPTSIYGVFADGYSGFAEFAD
jgi:DNA recombination protein RmuC